MKLLQIDTAGYFKVYRENFVSKKRIFASMCSLVNRYAFVSGGREVGKNLLDLVERYDLMADQWLVMPSLNVARHSHASCGMPNGDVYVFCGKKQLNLEITSIEKYAKASTNIFGRWNLIQVYPRIDPRTYPVLAALNSNEIVLIGGKKGQRRVNDVWIVDTRALSTKLIKECEKAQEHNTTE